MGIPPFFYLTWTTVPLHIRQHRGCADDTSWAAGRGRPRRPARSWPRWNPSSSSPPSPSRPSCRSSCRHRRARPSRSRLVPRPPPLPAPSAPRPRPLSLLIRRPDQGRGSFQLPHGQHVRTGGPSGPPTAAAGGSGPRRPEYADIVVRILENISCKVGTGAGRTLSSVFCPSSNSFWVTQFPAPPRPVRTRISDSDMAAIRESRWQAGVWYVGQRG